MRLCLQQLSKLIHYERDERGGGEGVSPRFAVKTDKREHRKRTETRGTLSVLAPSRFWDSNYYSSDFR